MLRIAFFNWVFFIFFSRAVFCQDSYEPHNFRLYSTKEGFYGDKVCSIVQDNDGFIWIGTNEGIFKYDGWKFDRFSIQNKKIDRVVNGINRQLFKDATGDIWIGSNTGLCRYQSKTRKFKSVKFPSDDDYFITGISQDAAGQIWTATNKGIYSITSDSIALLNLMPGKSAEMYRLTFYMNKLWIINYNSIYVFDPHKKILTDSTRFNNDIDNTDNYQTAMTTDKNGNIWIGKYNGIIYKFNTSNKAVTTIDTKKEINNPATIINYLSYDSISNKVWTAIDEAGIFTIDINNSLAPFIHSLTQTKGIPTLKITSVVIDRERNVWWSMEKNGLAMTNKLLNSFSIVNPIQNTTTSLTSAILKDSKENLWIGTDGGGLLKYSKDGKLLSKFRHDPSNPSSISNDAILAIEEDSKGRIWIGSFRGGLSLYHPQSNTFTNHLAQKNNSNTILRNDVRRIVEDKDGNLWLIIHGQGVSKYDPSTNVFTNYTNDNSLWTFDLIIDHKGIVWVSSNNGISYYDKNQNRFIEVKPTQINLDIHTIYEDRKGTFWIGSVKGLYFFDKNRQKLQQLNNESILNNVSIKSIEELPDGSLAFATSKGLVIYNSNTKQSSYFNSESGLPGDEFIVNSSFNFNNREIFFGTNKGLIYFSPGAIKPLNLSHKPVMTSILLFNEPIENVLDISSSIDKSHKLNLHYDENNLTLNFSYPYYTFSSSVYYFEYKMDGIDHTWKRTNSPIAVYPSLPSGKYLFKARMISKSTEQNYSPELVVEINISPPFWDTIWFKILVVVAVAIAFYFYYKQKTKSIIAKNRELEEKVRDRTEAISKQKELLEKQRGELQQANESKDKLFSIIAHDLRSPFSSILAITNVLQDKYEKYSKEEVIKMIRLLRFSSENAFQLLDNLLEWAKSQTKTIKYTPEEVSLKELCETTISFYRKIAEDKGISIEFESEADILALTDKEMLRTILRNLINNAIKFTPNNGQVTIRIKTKSEAQFILEIEDTGKGMTPEMINQILKSNTSLAPQQGTMGEKGTGIGLWICKEFLSHINGRWEITSEVNKGTTFGLLVSTSFKIVPANHIKKQDKGNQLVTQATTSPKSGGTIEKLHNKVILIVEDQPDILESLRILLIDHYQLLTAKNGSEAWDIIQDNYVDLILSDVVMPEMDGLTLSIKCKEQVQTNHIPIILLTSQKEELDIIKGLQTGIDDYLIKPVHSEILLLKINHLLNSRDLFKKKFSLDNKELLASIAENSVDKQFLAKVIQLIDEHLHEETFGVEELSKHIGMHRTTLSKKLVSVAEVSPNELIKIQRLKKAAQLLIASGLTISEIAYDVGFSDPKYFSKSFKAYFGTSPSEYVEQRIKE